MRRLAIPLAVVVLVSGLVIGYANYASVDGVSGNWRVTFVDGGQLLTFWLLKLETKDGKLAATVDTVPQGPQPAVENVAFQGDTLTFTFVLGNGPGKMPLSFIVKTRKGDASHLRGMLTVNGEALPVQLEATKDDSAKDFKAEVAYKGSPTDFKELKASAAKSANDLQGFLAAQLLVAAAVKDKVPAAELKAALSPVLKAATDFGDWHRDLLLRFARQFADQDAYSILAEDYAKQAMQEFGANASADVQLRGFDIIAVSLLKQNKKDELAKVRARIDDLEIKGHEENEKAGLGFTPDKFGGRKHNRAVLVELFTGAYCPPCVAADLAFEGLAKTYPTSEVVLLQYHLHIPRPDPMTTPESEARAKYYGDDVQGTPSIFFNGKSPKELGGGGPRQYAGPKYQEYRKVIEPLLDEDTKITLAVEATRTGDRIAVTASAAGYKPAETLKLRLALVEPWVRYTGGNGLSYHAHVVRAFVGSPAGYSLAKDNVKEAANVDLAQVRQTASKELDPISFLNGQRPFSYRSFRLVAFVQDDDTKQVLQAIEVPVK